MRGFTLIETLVYIALLSIIMGGALTAVYGLIEGSQKINTRTTIQEEGNFVLRKIRGVLSNTTSVTMPSPTTPTSSSLIVVLYDGSNATVRFNAASHLVEIQRGAGNPFVALTSTNVKAENLQFNYLSGIPAGIDTSLTINGFLFKMTKYLHK